MNRRTFLKIAGMSSISFAFGCNPPQKNLFSQVHAPDDMVTGKAIWYASTCRECPAGCGVLAKNREGRIVKIEGNPLHPINQGKICMRGQAALQGLYNPDRIMQPLLKDKGKWRGISFSKAQAILKRKAEAAVKKGSNRVRMLTEVVGDSMLRLFTATLENWNSQGPLVFEPYAYESLKSANEQIFGVSGLPSYRLDQADVLLAFGADFLETWLSPVEYAWKFKAMHTVNHTKKGVYFHVSPVQSLTGANADFWLACNPGSEATIALGLVKQALDIGKGKGLSKSFRNSLYRAVSTYTQERVLRDSGLPLSKYEKLILPLMEARKPLILGTATGMSDLNGLKTNLAVNLLNLLLDFELRLFDFKKRHQVEIAATRKEVDEFFKTLKTETTDLLLLNNVNPVFAFPPTSGVKEAINESGAFVVSFSNFMDETSALADLILPTRLPLESWDEYSGQASIVSTLQPAMGKLTSAPHLGDVFVSAGLEKYTPGKNYKAYLVQRLISEQNIADEKQWIQLLQKGGLHNAKSTSISANKIKPKFPRKILTQHHEPSTSDLIFIAAPSIRFFDGRGANKPWLSEIPDPLSRVAWQSPAMIHPQTANKNGVAQEDIVKIRSKWGSIETPVYATELVKPGTVVMGIGQGHTLFGRYAQDKGVNPIELLTPEADSVTGGPHFIADAVTFQNSGQNMKLARMYGSRTQHGRTFALSVKLEELRQDKRPHKFGLTMDDFPLTLPLPEGYDPKRDFYPPHDHKNYRWGMVVDLDRCIGCGACTAACYAENNIGIAGVERVIEGREMTWLSIERYQDEQHLEKVTFLPMLCQHCDNAPCESVCPVYAPHHSKEGLNNQIYNRCIGTRFCVQNCPYKVRRFNWFDWKWPEPMNLQLNPDVTVRSKGVMEKCSFCIQRIKSAHGVAKNEKRVIRDGEVIPACVQTCPTDALVFGNLMDNQSRVRKLVDDPRAYQVMGYLNTKPAVIYLKKVIQEI
ncbi:MAG: 4Fe-4S dicluster domain-containing protein [Desulfobacterales bacterium]|nr:MAG: 4Fe-4S dicluster domain-containing protein [Desulfobacterales bacterium]